MRYFKIVMIVIVLFAFVSCKRNKDFCEKFYKVKVDNVEPQLIEINDNLKAPFHLKEVKRVEIPLGGYPKWVKTPNENELILLCSKGEKGGHGVLFYDNELNLTKRKIIKNGEGPGEVTRYPFLLGSKNKLFLINNIRNRLTILDYNFNILEEKKYNNKGAGMWGFAMYLIKNNTEILHLSDVWKEKLRFGNKKKSHDSYAMRTLNIKDCSINILRSEDIMNDTKRRWMFGIGVHWTVHNNFIYFVDLKDYIVSKMDFNGKVLKKIKIEHEEKEFSQDQLDKWRIEQKGDPSSAKKWSFPKKLWSASFICKIKDGFAIGRREDYSPKEREYITADYFTWDMEYKGKINLPLYGFSNFPVIEERVDYRSFYKEPYFYTVKEDEEADFIIKWDIVD